MPPELTDVRLRLLPWRPRWRRARKPDGWELADLPLPDDPVSALIGLVLLVVVVPVLLVVVLGVLVLSVELALLLLLVPLAWVVQLVGLRPWRLVLHWSDGSRSVEEVRGTRAVLRRRRELLACRPAPSPPQPT